MSTKEQEVDLAQKIREKVNELNVLTNLALESDITVQISMTTRENNSGSRVPSFRVDGAWSSLISPSILLPK